jgi:glutaredoxin-like protein
MAMFSEKVLRETKEVLRDLKAPVTLTFFSREKDCGHCSQMETFAGELTAVDDRLKLEKRSLGRDGELAAKLGIHQAPALVLTHPHDDRVPVRYYGLPGGYEFGALLRILVLFSTGTLAERIESSSLEGLTKDVNIKTFVLTTCPSCPTMAYLTAALAFVSPRLTTEIIEANTFTDLAARFSVSTVPKVVINDSVEITGVLPPSELIAKILEA